MRVEGWIAEDNVDVFVELVASAVGGRWDDGDQAALDHGLADTDLEADRWFDHPIGTGRDGQTVAVIALAHHVGTVVVGVRIDVEGASERLVGRLEALQDVCASHSVT